VLLQPIPNRAERGSPMAYLFGYMGPNPTHAPFIKRVWPAGGEAGYKQVQSIGPSPVLIHRADLEEVAGPWSETAVKLKTDPQADRTLGWVIEMWGYSIASASIGLRHQVFRDFQVEPGALSSAAQLDGFPLRYWIFHYTYQFEYYLDGTPCQPWTIGEFSLDKRHFSAEPPPYPLPDPPPGANKAAFFLVGAFNEAMRALGTAWPRRQPAPGSSEPPLQSVYGRRRLDWFGRHANGFATELRTMPLIKRLVGSEWACEDGSSLQLGGNGDARWRSGRSGRWGSMNNPDLGGACPVGACIYVDVSGSHNVAVNGSSLTVMRLFYRTASATPEVVARCHRSGGGA